jgi:hypothetical protein
MDQKKAIDAFAKLAELPTQITEEEMEQWRDMDWAINDPEVKRKHEDELVAVYRRQIVAHGQDMKAILDEAERVTGLPRNKIAVTNIPGPGSFFASR